ncbi:MAG: glycosyltransferase family 2 protein [Lachnospiraceae bacterium]|nr:glycosyltransferase family 2 protein [Lachnospiraceae bacterium]
MKDKVSIIIPVYNAEKYIRETVASVKAQTYENWELLLVEDGSFDASRQLLTEMTEKENDERVRLICQENSGVAKARNKGLSEATGRFISYLDADDLWSADKLEKQLAFMEEKQAAFSFTGYEFANEEGKGTGKIVKVPETLSYRQALKNTTIFTSTVMFDTEKIEKDKLKMPVIKSEDTALWFSVLRTGHTAYGLNENLVRYRRGGESLSSNKLEALKRIWNLYRKAEHLSVPYSMYNFCFWALRAVKRRI